MRKRFTITIDREVLKKAKIKAVEEDKNFSSLVEELLRRYLSVEVKQNESTRNNTRTSSN